jgi:signal transduction histidine kinase
MSSPEIKTPESKISANSETFATAAGNLDVGTFLRAAAHEMANQINAISMSGELIKLLIERGDTARAGETVDRMLADCTRSGRMVRAMERFGSVMRPRARETVSVSALLEGAMSLYIQERATAKTDVQLELDRLDVHVDQTAVMRAIAGLLHNATEAGAGEIRVSAHRTGNRVSIAVSDDGGGIPPKVLARVIEPFFTTRRSNGHNGLGLTLADEIARAHGGSLSIHDNGGVGTSVTMSFPLGG